ncbi:hypothetical protein J6590_015147 [Homalodisca vitripennis]|nr:hypothetical protein J6590_015147 [Homalodisca vitripennis]
MCTRLADEVTFLPDLADILLQADKCRSLPGHEVDADDTLRLVSLVVVDQGGLCSHPDVASSMSQEPIPSGLRLSLGYYWNTTSLPVTEL